MSPSTRLLPATGELIRATIWWNVRTGLVARPQNAGNGTHRARDPVTQRASRHKAGRIVISSCRIGGEEGVLVPKVAIFDVDGTLVDSVDVHAGAWQEALERFGHHVTFEECRSQI